MGQGVVALCAAWFPGSAALEGDQLRHDYSGFRAERKIAAKILSTYAEAAIVDRILQSPFSMDSANIDTNQ